MQPLRIDATSPLIHYDGPGSDPQAKWSKHRNHIHVVCNDTPCSATLKATGIGSSILAVGNCNDDSQKNCLSGQLGPMNGTPNDSQNQLQVTFEGPPGQTLSVNNSLQLNGTDFEFHYINWTSTVSSSKPEETFHSKESLFHFDGEWNIDDKGSSTSKVGASVNFTFQGDHVALYGVTGQGTSYTAQLDGDAAVQLGQVFDFTSVGDPPPNQLIFFGNNFSSGPHYLTLKLTANAASPSFPFTVNYATVDGDVNPQNSSSSSPSTSAVVPGASANGTHFPHPPPFGPSGDHDHHGLTQTQIIGLVVGITVSGTLLLIALGYILCMRRRRNKAKKKAAASEKSYYDLTPTPPPPPPTQPLYYAPTHTDFSASSAPVLPMPTNANDDPNIQIYDYDFERAGVDRSHSYYSQSSMTLADGSEGIHQTDAYGRYKIQSIARDSEGYFVKGKTTQRYTAENLGGTQGGGEGGLGYAI
ncbi:hypothetical protein R3P38DRAFT_2837077 [Favolaschia claudopus]|uniref:Uncharacterized protein n=1 Tax=Favolaschia claudopus TaxID=2862362 RepID=A0AAW0E750_9AGAR